MADDTSVTIRVDVIAGITPAMAGPPHWRDWI